MNTALLDALPSVGIAFDIETWLARPKFVPPLVCGSACSVDGAVLMSKEDARKIWRQMLAPGYVIIGANIAFDMIGMLVDAERNAPDEFFELLVAVFEKYERGEIFDILIAEALDAIAEGHLGKDPRTGGPMRDPSSGAARSYYGLAIVVDHVLGLRTAKESDFWRKRYAILDRVPMDLWPADARKYPVDDSRNAFDVALAQCGHKARGDGSTRRSQNLHAVADIARAAFALGLGAVWGFAVDRKHIDKLEADTIAAINAGADQFIKIGLVRREERGKDAGKLKKNLGMLKKLVALAYGGVEGSCVPCGGTGKRPSEKSGKPINCVDCSGSGVDLDSSPSIPRTPPSDTTPDGGVMTERSVLIDSGSELLYDFGEWGEQDKILSTYIPALKDGLPMIPNVPLANERVSYAGIIQTMPRAGAVRESVVSREDKYLSSVDLAGIEFCTFGQVALWICGFSDIVDAINAGMDPHCALAAEVCGLTYEETYRRYKAGDKQFKDYRQASKWGNYGFGGGMGTEKFVITNRKAPAMFTPAPDGTRYKGVRFCLLLPIIGGKVAERCGAEMITEYKGRSTVPVCKACVEAGEIIKSAWKKRWRETQKYFDVIGELVESPNLIYAKNGELIGGRGQIIHFVSRVKRGDISFTQAANSFFSALAAYGAKRALWRASKEAHIDRQSPLFGSRMIAFIHDELVHEHARRMAAKAAGRVGEIMRAELQDVCEDVKIGAEPALMRRVYKGAEPVFAPDGTLIPWEPRLDENESKEAWLERVNGLYAEEMLLAA